MRFNDLVNLEEYVLANTRFRGMPVFKNGCDLYNSITKKVAYFFDDPEIESLEFEEVEKKQIVNLVEQDFKKRIDRAREMQKFHAKSTELSDSYFVGMYNGMEYSLSIIENRSPDFK